MATLLRHIALVVDDLQVAEQYYRGIFDMQLIGREAQLNDGFWYTLPPGKDWDDARAAGVQLDMLALRTDDFVLALFRGDAVAGQVLAVGLTMSPEDIGRVRSRVADGTTLQTESNHLEFVDIYGITWQISAPGDEFRTAGVSANRWIEL